MWLAQGDCSYWIRYIKLLCASWSASKHVEGVRVPHIVPLSTLSHLHAWLQKSQNAVGDSAIYRAHCRLGCLPFPPCAHP